jgi:hypothetical protein
MIEDSRIKQRNANLAKDPDYYRNMAKKRWSRPGEKERSKHLFNSETARKANLKRSK